MLKKTNYIPVQLKTIDSLITRDAAVNGGLLTGVDNDERQSYGRVVPRNTEGHYPLTIPLH